MSDVMDGEKKNTGPAEVSFSSYLSTAEGICVHRLAEPANQLPHPNIAPSVGIHTPARLERNKTDHEGEISVFGAERYFNMKLNDEIPRHDDDHQYANKSRSLRMGNQVDDLHQMTPRRWPGTPSASSEASWNSQSTLLRSFTRNRYERRQKKADGRIFFSNLSCTGVCSDGKSVYVNQNVVDHRKEHIQTPRRPMNIMDRKNLRPQQAKLQVKDEFEIQSLDNREVFFGPPALNLKPGLQNISVQSQLDDDPRKSLEVFGSTAIKKGDITKNLERKLSMLTWDAIPNAPTLSSLSRSSQVDDIESDGSSDLFEIDNILGSGQPLFMRQESDGMSSCVTPYAPSETSIEWSVVTASAADCSFVSDYDEMKLVENMGAPGSKTTGRIANGKALPEKDVQRGRSAGILGCKSQKAIMVAETAYISAEKSNSKPSQLPQFPKPITPKSPRLLQVDIKVKDLDFP